MKYLGHQQEACEVLRESSSPKHQHVALLQSMLEQLKFDLVIKITQGETIRLFTESAKK